MSTEDQFWKLCHLQDADLESRIDYFIRTERLSTARLVAHLAEVMERRLHLKQAYPTMTAYCRDKLGMREDDAGRRIVAARVARRFPRIYVLLEKGELSLSVICKLKHYITETNHEQLIEGVRALSYRKAEGWLAGRFPRVDVRSSVRKLPAVKAAPAPCAALPGAEEVGPSSPNAGQAGLPAMILQTDSNVPPRPAHDEAPPNPATETPAVPPSPPPRRADSGLCEPLSAARYRFQFSAGSELKAKLELARDLMSHANPSGDFAPIVERALDLLIAQLKKQRFGMTNKPRGARAAKPERITHETRRQVAERDEMSCVYVDETGKRCGARAFLQFDHRDARGRGGGSGTDNVRQLCAAHNRLEAERVYGRGHVERAIAKQRAQRDAADSAEPRRSGLRDPSAGRK
jgi:hypothetical protein